MMPSFQSIRNAAAGPVLITICLAVASLATAHGDPAEDNPPAQGRLIFTNGDRLKGQPQSIQNGQELVFSAINLRSEAGFPLNHILSLQLDDRDIPPSEETLALVQLRPRFNEIQGDTIRGKITELTPESIKLDTWYGGMVSLKRSMVKSLTILNMGKGNYHGPNSLAEWTQSENQPSKPNETHWSFFNNKLISNGTGGIGKHVELAEKSYISFDASWQKTMQFKLQLYTNDITSTSPSACYEVNFPNNSHAYLRTVMGARIKGGGRWTDLETKPSGTQAHFDIFIDRKTGSVTIYIDGGRACVLQSQDPDPENLGKAIAFVSENNAPGIELSNISIIPWNGTTLPDVMQQFDKNGPGAADQSPHQIILVNGDVVPGTVGVVEQGRMIIETKHTPIRVPLGKIHSLSLGTSREEPKKYREDVRAWFHSGGFVTLKLASMTRSTISGFNQALGDVTLQLAAFRRIDFHIYDEEANETRKESRFR